MYGIAKDGEIRRHVFGVAAAFAALLIASACASGDKSASSQAPTGPTPLPGAPTPRDFTKAVVKSIELGKNTYMLEGEGGNITVAVGKDGVIVVDGQFAPLYDRIKVVIEGLTKKKVKYVVNSHFHGDHTGGNASFAKDGATIVAHENVKTRLAAGTVNAVTGAKVPPASPEALPKKTYKNDMKLRVKGRTAELYHPGSAHTDGDTYVYFKDANVLATGDIVFINRYPILDFGNGGSIGGMIATVEKFLKLANDKTKIVPGHGPLIDKAMLAEYRDMLVTSRDRIQNLVAEGKSEKEVLDAKPLADLDSKWAMSPYDAQSWVKMVYGSLKK